MTSLAATLQAIGDDFAEHVREALATDAMRGLSDAETLQVMAAASRIARSAEAVILEATAHVDQRSDSATHDERLTTRVGCRSLSELVQRVTRVSKRTAADYVTAARAVQRRVAPTTGDVLPAELPQTREALGSSRIGVDGVVAIAGPLMSCSTGRAAMLAADEELAATARGDGVDASAPACAEDLRAIATVWAMYLDQDGAEPREARALRKRGLVLGVCRDGLVPIRGNLLPDAAAQLQRIFDSLLNPKVDVCPVPTGPRFSESESESESDAVDLSGPAGAPDDRSKSQKQHDFLAMVLTTAAAAGSLPTLGGAAPTLVVSVRADDLREGRGFAHISGCDEPLSLASARHIACSGAVQRVLLDEGGRIVSIRTLDRVFNHHQRRAIGLRDGGCVIPGCHVTAEWCEIHHVEEHSRGGPTHTDNGVMLCWFHHRAIDSSGWRVRMRDGSPEVRGPAWWDSEQRWRAVTKSPTRMREMVARRT